jgi:hypothetical protein
MRPLVLFTCICLATAFGVARPAAQTQVPTAPLSFAYKGFNYVSYYNGAYENADSLPALVTTGANAVALDTEYGIDVVNSTVYVDATYTDSLTAVAATIAEAKGHGLAVMVRPLIDFLDPAKIGTYSVGDWRSFYNPADPAAFFASYQTMIVAVAQTAQANGAAILCIGTELDQLAGPAYLTYWTEIITAVRAVFSGTLVYSANWDAAISPWRGQHGLTAGTGDLTTQISFWSSLDFVGIDAYAPISDKASPVLADLIAGWIEVPSDPTALAVTGNQSLISYFAGVAAKIGKPLFFTEIGYESASDAAAQPAGSSTNIFNPALQANLYAAFFEAWQQSGNGTLTGVLFWNWDPNAAEVGLGNGANFSPQALPAQRVVAAAFTGRPVNAATTATHDFNGDRMSDIAWRDTSNDGDSGIAAIWEMNGTQVLNVSATGVQRVPYPLWTIIGLGDFNGDGYGDFLWRDNGGDLAIWEMKGTQIINPNATFLATVTGWSVSGIGDFNGDGMSDLLWTDGSGNYAIWEMNGTQIINSSAIYLANVSTAWKIVGVGDFNGDGRSDILWEDQTGDYAIWEMNGLQIINSSATFLATIPTNWNVIRIGDFNGDGMSDLLWADQLGNYAIWEMNGTQIINLNATFLANVTGWSATGTGDYNGDGKSDLLWTDGHGNYAIWEMNGTTIINSSAIYLANVSTDWAVQLPLGQ